MSDVNKVTAKDIAYATGKAILGSIPLAGAAAAELFGLLITPPLEKRREEWMNSIGEKLDELRNRGKINFEELSQDEQFIDVVLQATSLALKTSVKEKKQAFRNAIVNTALREAPENTKAQIFLNYIDTFTVWHIRILHFIDNPKDWFIANGMTPPSLMMGTLSSVLGTAFPDLKGEGELLDLIWSDLHNAHFHNTGNLNTMMTGDGTLQNRTTELGREFIHFISNND